MSTNDSSSELAKLQEQIDNEKHLLKDLAFWKAQLDQISDQARLSNNAYQKLSKEIGVLEGHGLKSIASRLTFQHKKLLARKREEAADFATQYEEALKQQKEPEEKIRFYENELLKIKGAKRRLEQIKQENLSALKKSAQAGGASASQLEREISELQNNATQLRKTLQSAQSAYATAEAILTYIESAEQAGRLDLYGGNIFTGMEKHQQLNRAKNLFSALSEQVKSFHGELANVHLQENPSLNTGSFLKFSDYVFDGVITDFIVLNRIRKSAQPVLQFRRQMEPVISSLRTQLSAVEKECAKKEGQLLQMSFNLPPF